MTNAVWINIGLPSSGKGTQAQMMADHFGLPHLSTGDVLRSEIATKSELGQKVERLIQQGSFVSDDLVNDIVKNRIHRKDCKNGFILDGYPRTIEQAHFLEGLLTDLGFPPPTTLLIKVSDDVVTRRALARGRPDDTKETIAKRLKLFREETGPVVDYLSEGDMKRIDGEQSPEDVFAQILTVMQPS